MKLTDITLNEAALILDIPNARQIVQAIAKVESNGTGILKDGRLKILFEGHIFWRQIKLWGANPEKVKGHEDVLYPKWTRIHYVGGAGEWGRWSKAVKLCKSLKIPTAAALDSASYGMFQTMGFNFRSCGYSSSHEMIADYNTGQHAMVLAVCKLIKNEGWIKYLNPPDWPKFAFHYNGPGYKENDYDTKLETAFHYFS